ncbi:MAG: hypothetical protein ACYTGX_07715 [Planctomycetota bacterium]|jgi:hypothetical protein
MTSRAWLLAMAAALAGLIAALTWPEASGPRRIAVQERELLGIDLEPFQAVCAQMETDRADFERGAGGADIPAGQPMGRFAATVSNSPAILEGTCGRAGVPLTDFLEILAAMHKASLAAGRLARWNAGFDRRADTAEGLAKSLARLGHEPPTPPTPETMPPWYDQLGEVDRANIAVWAEFGAQAEAAWAKAMRLAPAGAGEDNPGNPK